MKKKFVKIVKRFLVTSLVISILTNQELIFTKYFLLAEKMNCTVGEWSLIDNCFDMENGIILRAPCRPVSCQPMDLPLDSPALSGWTIGLIVSVVGILVMGLLIFSLKKLLQNQIIFVLGFILAASSRPVIPTLDIESGSSQMVVGGVWSSGLVPSAPPPTYQESIV